MAAQEISGAFWDNIEWNLQLVVAQMAHAKEVKTRARSGYYKIAFFLSASIIEALVHQLLRDRLDTLPANQIPFMDWECSDFDELAKKYCLNHIKLAICKRRHPRFELTSRTDFKTVNDKCLELGVFNNALFVKIEKIRILRNKVHLQGQDRASRRWARSDVKSCLGVGEKLIQKLN